MEYVIIPVVAFFVSCLTLFSGFGLGALLLPAFAFFFPIDLSVALTAIVHLLNNIFKGVLVGRHVNRRVLVRFGVPAVIAAFAGAALLSWLSEIRPLVSYELFDRRFDITPVKLVIAALMAAFALFEVVPRFSKIAFAEKYLPVGGVLSGFLGGLSGHQGPLRAAFLVRIGMSKEAFIATSILIACLVDVTRLAVYAGHFTASGLRENAVLLLLATLFAFAGAYLGFRHMKKVTMRGIQILVSVLLFVIAVLIGVGVV